jgi:hypothetical protein
MNDMKKQLLLVGGLLALYLAAKEYGINSLDDLKKALNPYLKMLDVKELVGVEGEDEE